MGALEIKRLSSLKTDLKRRAFLTDEIKKKTQSLETATRNLSQTENETAPVGHTYSNYDVPLVLDIGSGKSGGHLDEYDRKNAPKYCQAKNKWKKYESFGARLWLLFRVCLIIGALGSLFIVLKTDFWRGAFLPADNASLPADLSEVIAPIQEVSFFITAYVCFALAIAVTLTFWLIIPSYFVISNIIESKSRSLAYKSRCDYDNECKKYINKHRANRSAAYLQDLKDAYNLELSHYNHLTAEIPSLKREISQLSAEVTTLKNEYSEVDARITDNDILPPKYKYLEAVATIIDYFQDMRADSIKEAINLYVFESRERSRENIRQFEEERRLEERRETSRRLIEEAERRRKAAEETRDTMKDIKNKLDN